MVRDRVSYSPASAGHGGSEQMSLILSTWWRHIVAGSLPTFSQKPVRDPQAGTRVDEDAASLQPADSLLRACHHNHQQ